MTRPPDPPTRTTLWAVLILVGAMAAVFGQVGGHEFLQWDDNLQVVENPLLNPVRWRGVAEFWQRPYWGLYIPLSYTFFAGEMLAAGSPPSPIVFHLVNLALHVGCVLLVFLILRRLFGHDGAACFGALLFGLHPVQVESVAWISETRGVLCGVFSLLAVWLYLRYTEPSQSRRSQIVHYALATVAFLLALLCKPAAVAVPLLVAVLDVGLLRRPWRHVLLAVSPWLIVAIGWAALTRQLQSGASLPHASPLWARPLVAGDALAFYLYKLVAPFQCGPDYGRTPRWVMDRWWVFYVTWLLPALFLAALACLRNRRLWLTAAAVSIAWLLPVLGLVPFNFQRISTVADRYWYLAMLGPAIAASWLLAGRWNRLAAWMTATVLGLCGVLSAIQASHWHDEESLFTHGLRVNPHSVVAKQHLGDLLAEKGEHDKAIDLYREALEDHPEHEELYLKLADSLVERHREDEAVEELREALAANPQWRLARCQLAYLLAQDGAVDAAMEEYRTALGYDPELGPARLALGKLWFDRGEHEKAIKHYRRILDDVQWRVAARENLGVALEALGRVDEAAYQYRTVLKVFPGAFRAHYNLANLLDGQGKTEEAVEHYRAALKLAPGHARAHVNLGIALASLGKTRKAIDHYWTALRIDPELIEAHMNLGFALEAEGRSTEAEAALGRALNLAPPGSRLAEQIQQILWQHRRRSGTPPGL